MVTPQEIESVPADYRGEYFKDFVDEIEANTTCHFYYYSEEVDSIRIQSSVGGKSVYEALHLILDNTAFKFVKEVRSNFYIKMDTPIIATLPDAFFDKVEVDESDSILKSEISRPKKNNKISINFNQENVLNTFGTRSSNIFCFSRGRYNLSASICFCTTRNK